MAEETQNTSSQGGNKFMKALCYFTYLWLVPFFLVKGEERDSAMLLHLKQGFGGFVLCVLGNIFMNIVPIVGYILMLVCFLVNLLGFINAITGKDKPVPVLGEFFNSTFTFIK